jgi:ABC-type sugar transport system ATPase subunit
MSRCLILILKLREQMRTELKRLHQKLRITTIYVTHDQTEALTLSDRLAVMNNGEAQQIGSPMEIYERPSNLFVAEFIGSPGINILKATSNENGVCVGSMQPVGVSAPVKGDLFLGVRPEDVEFADPKNAILTGSVEIIEPAGSTTVAVIRLGQSKSEPTNEQRIVASFNPHGGPSVGERVGLIFRAKRLCLFGPDGIRLDAVEVRNSELPSQLMQGA